MAAHNNHDNTQKSNVIFFQHASTLFMAAFQHSFETLNLLALDVQNLNYSQPIQFFNILSKRKFADKHKIDFRVM